MKYFLCLVVTLVLVAEVAAIYGNPWRPLPTLPPTQDPLIHTIPTESSADEYSIAEFTGAVNKVFGNFSTFLSHHNPRWAPNLSVFFRFPSTDVLYFSISIPVQKLKMCVKNLNLNRSLKEFIIQVYINIIKQSDISVRDELCKYVFVIIKFIL